MEIQGGESARRQWKGRARRKSVYRVESKMAERVCAARGIIA